MKKILLADPLDKEATEKLQSLPGFEVTIKTGMDEAELIKTIPGFNAIVVRSATKERTGDDRSGRDRAGQRRRRSR
jgi:hypothetical protein